VKVFLSWSGQRSKAVAELLSDWIKCVLQASQPWISTRDIDKGAIWFSEISDQLKDTAAGIVCLTQENKEKPWILFETGALAKGLSTSRVCTFLIDLKSSDVEDPLAQFNHTFPDSSSMWGLVCSLNSGLDLARLDEKILRQVFETYWPQFDVKFKEIIKSVPAAAVSEPRTGDSILTEILANTRALTVRIRDIEKNIYSGKSLSEESVVDPLALLERMAKDDNISIQEILRVGKEFGAPESYVYSILDKYRIKYTNARSGNSIGGSSKSK
jgi:hypothetical protein